MNGTKDYYGGDANIYEVIKIIEHFNLDFREGNVLKYLLRAGKKDPSTRVEDLRKGLYYFQRLVDSEAQKDLTINIKCEDNLSPVLEEMHEKVQSVKSSIESDQPKLISELKVGDEIKAIDPFFTTNVASALKVGKFYPIKYINEYIIEIENELGNNRARFQLNELPLLFHVTNTPVLTPDTIKSIQDEQHRAGLS